jgi:toxin CptA
MHQAPSVAYPVGRSAFAARAYALTALLGLAAAVAWAWQAQAFGWRQAMALAAVLATGGFALHAWRQSAGGVLRWDGTGWSREEGAAAETGSPELTLDLQAVMLLRWRADDGGARWLWVERASDVSHWDALRRAVYSRASAPIPTLPESGKDRSPAGQPPAAEQ